MVNGLEVAPAHPRRTRRFFRDREWELYWFGLQIGWYNLATGGLRRLGFQKTLGKLLQPIIAPSRFSEFAAVLGQLPLQGATILDVGSPKIFDLWLAAHYPVEIFATDIWWLPTAEYAAAWRQFAVENRAPGRVHFVTTDGTKTGFARARFDCIFAISVIEHIEGAGDARFLDEAAELLVPGGRLVITVPFGTRYEEQYAKMPVYRPQQFTGPVFFQRVYDRAAAEQRLMQHELLLVEDVKTLGLRQPALERAWLGLPMRLRGLLGFLNPVISGAAPRAALDGFAQLEGDLMITYRRRN